MSIHISDFEFLFSTPLRADIMYDALCEGDDQVGSSVNLVEDEPGFDLDILKYGKVYQFNWYGDGGWLGVLIGDSEPTAENILSAPTITIQSDDYPIIHTFTTLPMQISQHLRNFLTDENRTLLYTSEHNIEDVIETTRLMLEEINEKFMIGV